MFNFDLTKYKSIFGDPNMGLHSYRIFDIAIVDLVATIIVAVLVAKYFETNIFATFILLFVIGEVFHYIFGVDTTVKKLIAKII